MLNLPRCTNCDKIFIAEEFEQHECFISVIWAKKYNGTWVPIYIPTKTGQPDRTPSEGDSVL